MKTKKDIFHLLEEVQTVAQILCSEKAALGDLVVKIRAEMSTLRTENAQIAHGVPSGRGKIDSLPPEVQGLKKLLQHAEFHNQLLEHEVSKQHDEIQELERRIENATSQASPSSLVDESIGSSSVSPLT